MTEPKVEQPRPQLASGQIIRVNGAPLLSVAIADGLQRLNREFPHLRDGPLGDLNPAEWLGNVPVSMYLGVLSFYGASLIERALPRMRRPLAKIALAGFFALGVGGGVNVANEVPALNKQIVQSVVPENVPFIRNFDDAETGRLPDAVAGIVAAEGMAVWMAASRQKLLVRNRRRQTDE